MMGIKNILRETNITRQLHLQLHFFTVKMKSEDSKLKLTSGSISFISFKGSIGIV